VIPYYLNCLEDNNEEIRRTALEHAYEFFPFAPDPTEYLKKLFLLGKIAVVELKKIIQNSIKFKA